MRRGVAHLDAAVGDLRAGLLRAERRIELQARQRIRALRSEGRVQLKELHVKQRAAAQMLRRLSTAADESWADVKRSADSILSDAHATAVAVGKRLRRALAG
ncbi:MAG: hypothetical protein ABI629_02075 [bacterium]